MLQCLSHSLLHDKQLKRRKVYFGLMFEGIHSIMVENCDFRNVRILARKIPATRKPEEVDVGA